jgi:hypothetical protein
LEFSNLKTSLLLGCCVINPTIEKCFVICFSYEIAWFAVNGLLLMRSSQVFAWLWSWTGLCLFCSVCLTFYCDMMSCSVPCEAPTPLVLKVGFSLSLSLSVNLCVCCGVGCWVSTMVRKCLVAVFSGSTREVLVWCAVCFLQRIFQSQKFLLALCHCPFV